MSIVDEYTENKTMTYQEFLTCLSSLGFFSIIVQYNGILNHFFNVAIKWALGKKVSYHSCWKRSHMKAKWWGLSSKPTLRSLGSIPSILNLTFNMSEISQAEPTLRTASKLLSLMMTLILLHITCTIRKMLNWAHLGKNTVCAHAWKLQWTLWSSSSFPSSCGYTYKTNLLRYSSLHLYTYSNT